MSRAPGGPGPGGRVPSGRTPRGRGPGDDSGGGLRTSTIAWAFAMTGVLGYLLQRYLNDHVGRMPFPSWPGATLPLALCIALIAVAQPIRRWKLGKLDRRLDPLRAFRTLILARATALTGGVVAGWYLAQALVLLPDAESASVLRGIEWCLAYVGSGALMVACGLLVQSWCRVDPPEDDLDTDDDPYEPR